MKRESTRKFKSSMATHFPSLSPRDEIDQNIFSFIEDIKLGIMPIGGKTEKHVNFTIKLQGTENDCERVEQLIADFGRYNRRDISASVCGAIEEIAWRLASEGSTAYEIIHDDQESIHMRNFTTKRLWKFFGYYVQIVPRADRTFWNRNMSTVPSDRVWFLEMPLSLGGPRHYKNLMNSLSKFPSLAPDFWNESFRKGNPSNSFDFQFYQQRVEVYWRKVTRVWGWNRRDWSEQRTTDFYTHYKLVCFSWAQAVLREHIVDQLNLLFDRLGIDCTLTVLGLPTAEAIEKIKSEYSEGSVPVEEIFERVKC